VAPTRASSQRPGLWKPLAPHALRAGFEATPGGGAFYGKTYSFDALSLTARSSFDSFDASSARSMLFASSASADAVSDGPRRRAADAIPHEIPDADPHEIPDAVPDEVPDAVPDPLPDS